MRELLEGREQATSLLTWDEPGSDVASRMPDDVSEAVSLDSQDVMLEQSVSRIQDIDEVSGLEMVSQVSTISEVQEPPTNPHMEEVEDEGAEKTRIEENPLARVLEMERAAAPAPAMSSGRAKTPAPVAAAMPSVRPAVAKLGPGDRTDPDVAAVPMNSAPHGKRRNAPGTSPPPNLPGGWGQQPVVRPETRGETPRSKSPTAPMAPPSPPRASPIASAPVRAPAPYESPAADVPTVIEGVTGPSPLKGFVRAPDA